MTFQIADLLNLQFYNLKTIRSIEKRYNTNESFVYEECDSSNSIFPIFLSLPGTL
jgi:hypothetical protein